VPLRLHYELTNFKLYVFLNYAESDYTEICSAGLNFEWITVKCPMKDGTRRCSQFWQISHYYDDVRGISCAEYYQLYQKNV